MSQQARVAVIVGGGSGVGRATAVRLANDGWAFAVLGRTDEALRETVGLAKPGSSALAIPIDAADDSGVDRAFRQVHDRLGRIDALVYTAGLGRYGPVENYPLSDWEAMLKTNLTGAFVSTRAALPYLRQRGGAIVAIGSGAAHQGYAGLAAYSAAKFGLRGYLQALAGEVGDDGIKVSLVNPGSIMTRFAGASLAEKRRNQQQGRAYLDPDDVARAVAYVLSQPPGVWTQELNVWPKTVPAHASGGEDSGVRDEPSGSETQPA
jgi:NAD(P)-dependent dehydrogenase (short-subunit alcohol dehydrogenase family)